MSEELGLTVQEWVQELVRVVDSDNTLLGLNCENTAARWVLRVAPDEVRQQAQLAVEDLLRAAGRPLAELRSDAVAHRFTVNPARSGLNALVARMTVPG